MLFVTTTKNWGKKESRIATQRDSPLGRRACKLSIATVWLLFPMFHSLDSDVRGDLITTPMVERHSTDTSWSQRVRMVIEVEGTMTSPPSDSANRDVASRHRDEKSQNGTVPLKVEGDFAYVERIVPANDARWALRWYQAAAADMTVGKLERQRSLRDTRRTVAIRRVDDQHEQIGIEGPISHDESELLEVPFASDVLAQALPIESKKEGESWQVNDVTAAQLFNLQAVAEQDLTFVFRDVDSGQARCTVSGTIEGMSQHSLTHLAVEGKLNVDLANGHVVWAAVLIREKRPASQRGPAFNVTARIRIRCAPTDAIALLADVDLASLTKADRRLEFTPQHGEFQLRLDPDWTITSDEPHRTVLEKIEGSASLAQCRIIPLPDLPIGKTITLDEFRQDVTTALGQNLQQISSATETTDGRQSRLRVVADGTVRSVGVRWIYYHVTSPEGRRTSITFTLGREQTTQFGNADELLVHELDFQHDEELAGPVAVPDKSESDLAVPELELAREGPDLLAR